MRIRLVISLLALVTVSLYSAASVPAATAATGPRLVLTEDGRSASFERRTDPAGQTYVAVVIQEGSKRAEIAITPAEILFDDGYSIRRSVETGPQDEHIETLTAFSPDREKSAIARIRLKAPLVTTTGRREVAALLRSSASYRLLVANRRFIAIHASREPGTEYVHWNRDPSTLTSSTRGPGDPLIEGALYVSSVAELILGGPDVSRQSEDVVFQGLRFAAMCTNE